MLHRQLPHIPATMISPPQQTRMNHPFLKLPFVTCSVPAPCVVPNAGGWHHTTSPSYKQSLPLHHQRSLSTSLWFWSTVSSRWQRCPYPWEILSSHHTHPFSVALVSNESTCRGNLRSSCQCVVNKSIITSAVLFLEEGQKEQISSNEMSSPRPASWCMCVCTHPTVWPYGN